MLIVKFQGGLGNQISQYAFTRLLQKNYPGIEIKADLSFYNQNHDHQGYELDRIFKSRMLEQASIIDIWKTVGQIVYPYRSNGYCRLVDKAFHGINRLMKVNENAILFQVLNSGYEEEKRFFQLDSSKNWYLVGYWHSYNYNLIMDDLRKELYIQPPEDKNNQEILKKISQRNSISIHIRRGDYVNSQYDIVDKEYYEKSVQRISALVDNPSFFVFSDDMIYAKNLISKIGVKGQVEYISWNQGVNSYYDMYLMSQCNHNIIANSTFSYWAAQLNANPQKIVIRPRMEVRDKRTWEVDGWILL